MTNPLQAIDDAERLIQERQGRRDGDQVDFRKAVALELIADDMTRLRAEIETIRNILAGMAARQGR